MNNVTTYRFCRTPFGVVSSSFLLSATIKHHLQVNHAPAATQLLAGTYVDNLLTGDDNPEDAVALYSDAKRLFHSANMNLREWASNSDVFLQEIPETDHLPQQQQVKVLGLSWRTQEDTLSLAQPKQVNPGVATKRSVLQHLSAIFDPLGLVSPVTVMPKLLIQELWASKLGWDDPLPPAIQARWEGLCESLQCVSQMSVPRHIGVSRNSTVELHVFADASKSAFAACVYGRVLSEQGEVLHCHLLMSKARVAPLKAVSMPRLELLAATTGARLLKFVLKELGISSVKNIFWGDSKCVLYWMGCQQRLHGVFVENRLQAIRQAGFHQYRYVNTAENPADLPSRGVTAATIRESDLWWNGPAWLMETENSWPQTLTFDTPPEGAVEEERKSAPVLVAVAAELPSPFDLKAADFPSLDKLLTRTAWCLRAVECFRKRVPTSGQQRSSSIQADEIDAAKKLWERHSQRAVFPHLMDPGMSLFSVQPPAQFQPEKHNRKETKLGLVWDATAGLIRCAGRLRNAELPETTRCPILLPRCDYTTLVVMDVHERLQHAGAKHTLSEMRLRHWIPAGGREVGRVVHRCRRCRRWEGGVFRPPPPPPLPSFRVERSRPFSVCGLDYLGPLHCAINDDVRSADTQKVWIALFTCAATRAVHLEAVPSLTTAAFLDAYRRFCAMRGAPTRIISDNARHFRLAASTMDSAWKDCLQSTAVQSLSANRGTDWTFTVELAPWMGGFYERLVGSVKRSLRKTLDNSRIAFLPLQTVLKEIEAVLNSRPITPLGSEPENGPLTPAHFLGNPPPNYCLPVCHDDDNDDLSGPFPPPNSREGLLRRWKQQQHLLNSFWKSWSRDYLASLRQLSDANPRPPHGSHRGYPMVGQLVLIKEANLPRGSWRMGVIAAVQTSADGRIRSASVRTKRGTTLRRPLKLIVPLEVQDTAGQQPMTVAAMPDATTAPEEVKLRPGRQSKATADAKIKSLASASRI